MKISSASILKHRVDTGTCTTYLSNGEECLLSWVERLGEQGLNQPTWFWFSLSAYEQLGNVFPQSRSNGEPPYCSWAMHVFTNFHLFSEGVASTNFVRPLLLIFVWFCWRLSSPKFICAKHMPGTLIHIFNATTKCQTIGKDLSLYFAGELFIYVSIFIGHSLPTSHRSFYVDPSNACHWPNFI